MIAPLPPPSADGSSTLGVFEPYDINDGCACGEQYEQGSGDPATPCSGGFGFASEDESAGDA